MFLRIIITQLGNISIARDWRINERVASLGFDGKFGGDSSSTCAVPNAQNQFSFQSELAIVSLLCRSQIPVGIEGVGILRQEQQLPRSISFGQCSGFRGLRERRMF